MLKHCCIAAWCYFDGICDGLCSAGIPPLYQQPIHVQNIFLCRSVWWLSLILHSILITKPVFIGLWSLFFRKLSPTPMKQFQRGLMDFSKLK
jgi:hypothetical protein